MKETITMDEIRATSTWSVKDDSPRGCKTVNNSEVKPGDKVVYNNRFALVIDEPETEKEETTKRTTEEVTTDIIAFFKDNEDIFNEAIEELDAYNGYLGDNRYYTMDELDECFIGTEPSEILRRAFYGYDEETYSTDGSGNREYGQFNPNRDYFTYNGYGNLVSADYKDYTGYLDKYAIEAMGENRRYIDSIEQSDELAVLFDELENTEN